MAQRIRQGDTVQVIRGRDRGKRGKVERVLIDKNRLVVEGVNQITRHMRAQPRVRQAGRVQQEAPIHVSNVVIVCDKCDKPTRINFRHLADTTKTRECKRCREVLA